MLNNWYIEASSSRNDWKTKQQFLDRIKEVEEVIEKYSKRSQPKDKSEQP